MRPDGVRERPDIDGIGGIGRHGADRRLAAHRLQRIEGLVVHARGGRGGILRVEREEQQAIAALRLKRLNARGDRRAAVAHRPIDDQLRAPRERRRNLLALRRVIVRKRRLVQRFVPDGAVFLAAFGWPDRQHDKIEDQPPQRPVGLDDAAVGEELLEVAAHRPVSVPSGVPRLTRSTPILLDAPPSPATGQSRREALSRRRFVHPRHSTNPSGA